MNAGNHFSIGNQNASKNRQLKNCHRVSWTIQQDLSGSQNTDFRNVAFVFQIPILIYGDMNVSKYIPILIYEDIGVGMCHVIQDNSTRL